MLWNSLKHLIEVLLMSTNNICFWGEIKKKKNISDFWLENKKIKQTNNFMCCYGFVLEVVSQIPLVPGSCNQSFK